MAGGILSNHLMAKRASGKLAKVTPELRIEARMSTPFPGEGSDDKYLKEDMARVKKEIAAIEKALDNWIPEDVAARAEKSLRSELAVKKARIAELDARLSAGDDEDDDEEESEEE
jgi:hypothetical protein